MEEGVGSIEFGPVLVASILLPVGCVGLAGEKEIQIFQIFILHFTMVILYILKTISISLGAKMYKS